MAPAVATRRALVCRNIRDAEAGGILEDVEISALVESMKLLRLLEPAGAKKVEDRTSPDQPMCVTVMPKSMRLLRVRHLGRQVGVVVPTFKGGKAAQRDGLISEASAKPNDRSNLHRFFEGGTIGWD